MAARASWKGYIRFADVTCPVGLYTAVSSSERIVFHMINRKTGNRVHRVYVDSKTGDRVERDAQVKGYEVADGQYLMLEPDEIAADVPESDKTLAIEAFIPCHEIDDVYFDKPYYVAPDKTGQDAFVLLRDGMRKAKVAAIARTVLFRQLRSVLIRPHGSGLIATTLNFDYEVRSSEEAFDDVADVKIDGEMLDLASHIIETKAGTFDARDFDDRYETALTELVKAKLEGKKLPKRKIPAVAKPTDLMQALRESAGVTGASKPLRKASTAKGGSARAPSRRKAS